jgi:hypothetical protein
MTSKGNRVLWIDHDYMHMPRSFLKSVFKQTLGIANGASLSKA